MRKLNPILLVLLMLLGLSAKAALPSGVNASDASNTYWYAIKSGSNALSFPATAGASVTSVAYNASDASIYVKFVEVTTDVYKIVTLSGLEVRSIGSQLKVVAAGQGDTFVFDASGTILNKPAMPKGLWEFNDPADLAHATIGNDLEYRQNAPSVAGTAADFASETGAAGIANTAVKVLKTKHFFLDHGMAANGGGSRVNQYTVVFDFNVPVAKVWHTFLQTYNTNPSGGTYDAVLFGNQNTPPTIAWKSALYFASPTAKQLVADTWYRLVASVDLTATGTVLTCLDEVVATTNNANKVDNAQCSIDPTGLIFFGDGDGDDADIIIDNVALWDRALSADEITALGVVGTSLLPVDAYVQADATTSATATTFAFAAAPAAYELTLTLSNLTVTSATGATLVSGATYEVLPNTAFSFTLTPTLGYELTSVPSDYTLTDNGDGTYTVSNAAGLSGNSSLTLTATLKSYTVTVVPGTNVSYSGSLAQSVQYGLSFSGSFTLTGGYHAPYVTVNGVITAVSENGGTYTIPAQTITGATTVNIDAYPANVVPVSEDTYIDGRSTSADNSLGKDIRAQASSSSYQRVSVLKFDVSGISSSSYNKAMLSFVIKNKQKTTKETLVAKEVIGYALTNAFSSINYSNSGTDLYNNASVISSELDPEITVTTDVNKQVEIDITGYVFGNLSDNLRVALTAGTSGVQDGTVFIHSLENGNYAYVPQLIFSAPTSLSEVMPDESNAPVRYYNLQGVEVAAPTKGAIYIVRQGAKAKKVVY